MSTTTTGSAFVRDEPEPSPAEIVAGLIQHAVDARSRGDGRTLATCLETLADPRFRSAVEPNLAQGLQARIRTLWHQGWQPADLVRMADRQVKAPHQQLLRAVVAAELAGYARNTVEPRWWTQAEEAGIRVWWGPGRTAVQACAEAHPGGWRQFLQTAVELAHLLFVLPPLQRLDAVPGTAAVRSRSGPDVDERILARVRALLAKAESTNYPAEAETFTAGAQALMARHSIDQALLAATGRVAADEPAARRVGVDTPYEAPKMSLLSAVASANRCRAVWARHLGFATVVGHPTDLDLVEVLYTSLLVQGTAAMTREGTRTDRYGGSRTRSFRQSFLVAYAERIRERLTGTTEQQTESAAAEPGRQHLLPLLAAHSEAVERVTAELFPHLQTRRSRSVLDGEGYASGRAAADLATIGAGKPLPETSG